MTKRLVSTCLVAAVAALVAASSGGTWGIREGGTFRVGVPTGFFDAIDPALFSTLASAQLLRPACGTLMGYPNKPTPAGLRLEPELAQSDPLVSRDGRTYTFTIRKDARFSSGAPVTARAFVRALERTLDPGMQSPYAQYFQDIAGGQAMLAGKTTTLAGAVARGRTLILRLTKRLGDFAARTSLLCAVPAGLPADPEGAKAPLPSAAPYYVAEYVPNERLMLERNRFYRGERPHHVATITANLGADAAAVIDQVASGEIDYTPPGPALAQRADDLAQRYGVNKSQFFVVPGLQLRMFVLNTSRPLFKGNVKLRQAVNLAVDRKTLTREFAGRLGTVTDQYLPPAMAGYRNERIYPLEGPDLSQARALAAGRTRSGKAVLYTCTRPDCVASAQIFQRNLKGIGLEVEIKQFPIPLYFEKLATRGEPFDVGFFGWAPAYNDPREMIAIFDGRTIGQPGSGNFSHFNSPTYNRLMDRAERLSGPERYRAYGELDVQLSRDAAPGIPFAVLNEPTFVSAKAGCVVLNPFLDLTAVCLK